MAAALHVCNDAFFALLYPLLPFIAAELGLSYAEVGLVKAAFTASAAVLQLPAGLLAERVGEYALLAWGNGWVAAGLLGMAFATTFPLLLLAAIAGGLGGNVQHPLASAMVARAYEAGRRGTAIGTLNFAGDLGKMAAPVLVALVTIPFGWRATLLALALFGLIFSLAVGLARPWARPPEPSRGDVGTRALRRSLTSAARLPEDVGGPRSASPSAAQPRLDVPPAYWLLGLVGMLDASTRAAALTFLPFTLEGRGVGTPEVGLLFGLIFAGGAAGKLLCGALGDRLGPLAVVLLTEATTAFALLGLAWGPPAYALGLAVVFGFALNGTSSVLYAAVAGLVPEGKRGRGYGLYYTAIDVAAAGATLGYGLVADHLGLDGTFGLMAALTLAIVPLAIPLRRRLAATS
jgi:MFS transporter, FSR family, fosmidomycin resistance protein